jgi:hypothetical protein
MDQLARRMPQLVAAIIVALFLWANARGLDVTPPINEDEPWIAAPGVEFFTTGRFATPVFAGYYGSEHHYYDFMPLMSLLDGASIRGFGMSLVSIRALSLTLAAITLVLTYFAGRRFLSEWHAVIAMVILALWPIATPRGAPLDATTTGIPLADLGRIARYDILVPVFGLASLLAVGRALAQPVRPIVWLALSGALAGLATLSHYYGVLWLAVIAALIAAASGRKAWAQLRWTTAGFSIVMMPWVWFISRDFSGFLVQKQAQAHTYFGDMGSLWAQVVRFVPVLSAARRGHLASLLWIALVCVGVVLLIRASRPLAITIGVIVVGFAILVRPHFTYLGTLWPLLALAASCAVLHPWPRRARALGRGVLALGMAAVTIQGIEAYRQLAARAGFHTPYPVICDRIAAALPQSARLLALQHWWLGVSPRVADYRSFLVPITRMHPRDGSLPMSFEQAMALDPMDYILIDPSMLQVVRASGNPKAPVAGPIGAEIREYLRARAVLVTSFEDRTYGRFALYRVNAPEAARSFR